MDDIANVFQDAYSRSAPVILADIHEYSFNFVGNYLTAKKNPKFLVIGPGTQFLPFSQNPDRVIDMMHDDL